MSEPGVESPEHSDPPHSRTISVPIPVLGLGAKIALIAAALIIVLGLVAWFTGPTRAEQQAVAARSDAVATAVAEASKSAEVWATQQSASASAKSAASASQSSAAAASSIASVKASAAESAAEQAVRAWLTARNPKATVSGVDAVKDPATGDWVVKLSYYATGADSWSTTHVESHRVSVADDGTAKVTS